MSRAPSLAAIVGGSGAGKTHLARLLQRVLGKDAAIISLDDFYKDRSLCPPTKRAQINFDHPRAIDWKSFKSVLEQLRQRQSAIAPRYNFKTHQRLKIPRRVDPRPVILVEGLWLLHCPSLRRLFDCKIFMACPARTRLRRRLERDAGERGRSAASIRHQFFTTVAPMHRLHVAPQVRWADIVVRSELSSEDLCRLAMHLKGQCGADSLASRALLPRTAEDRLHYQTEAYRRIL